MNKQQILTLSYGLTYLAMACAINNMPFSSLLVSLAAIGILIREIMNSSLTGKIKPLLINGIFQIVVLVIGLNSLLETSVMTVISTGLLVTYNILFTYVLTLEELEVRTRTMIFTAVTFILYALLMVASDIVLKYYLPFIHSAILPAYWIITLLMATSLLVTVILVKPVKNRIIIQTTYTTDLS